MSSKKKKRHHVKHNAGGEPSSHAKALHEDAEADRQFQIDVSEGHDHKRGNIGPSGQGSHRGREARTHQTNASGGSRR